MSRNCVSWSPFDSAQGDGRISAQGDVYGAKTLQSVMVSVVEPCAAGMTLDNSAQGDGVVGSNLFGPDVELTVTEATT